jgi:predicted Zn-dependent peptidase
MSFQNSKLSNGINVVTFNMPNINSVSINVIVKVGSRYETLEESGISHFLEHMAFKGTASRSAENIAEEFDIMGGHFNAYTSREQTVYYTKVLRENFEKALHILADILQNSLFTEKDIKKELSVIMQEIAGVNDNPDDLVYEKFYSLAFSNQPIGRSILGKASNLKKFNKESFTNFMAKHYTTDNIYIAVAGNASHHDVLKLAEKHFIQFPKPATQTFISSEYIGGFEHTPKTLEQTSVALGFKSVSYANILEFYSAQILSVILGGGLSSRLFQQIREKLGLAYSVGSFNSSYYDNGIFSIYAATDHKNVKKLLDNLGVEIKKIQEYISEEELQRAKSQIKTNILMAEERSEYKSEEIGKNFALFGKYFPTEEVLDLIAKTTTAHLTTSAQKIFASNPTLSIVGEIPKSFDFEKFRTIKP